MTEREKMGQRMLYDANYDQELLAERARCKDLCFLYNQIKPSLAAEQENIIRQLFGKTGKYSIVFRAKDRTLEEADVSAAMKKILKGLEELGIELRQ